MTVTIAPLTEREFFAWYGLFADYAAGAGVEVTDEQVMRVWTTVLALATLERFNISWSATDRGGGGAELHAAASDSGASSEESEEEEEGPPRSILDEANEWLHRQHFTLPPPARASSAAPSCTRSLLMSVAAWAYDDDEMGVLEDEAGTNHKSGVKLAALRQVRVWAERSGRALRAVRAAERPRPEHYSLLLQRSAGNVARAALTKHETFRRAAAVHARSRRQRLG